MTKEIEEHNVIFTDYPVGKFARKIDWWTSDKGIQLIAGWRQAGCTIEEIRNKVGVDPRTFRAWRKKCPALEDALVLSKEIANVQVINSLYQRAVGMEYDEITRELVEGELRVTKIVTKYIPPDVKAILAFLYNRDSQNWRAVQQPIDTDTPAILNADDVLVNIRNIAEKASLAPPLNGESSEGREADETASDQGNASGSFGEIQEDEGSR